MSASAAATLLDVEAAEIAFGPFRLDRAGARLLREGRAVALTPKAFDVLSYLVGRAGKLVTKEELLSAVWADVIVGDASVKVCVREVRAALGDDVREPKYIETVHRRGYRFIGGSQGQRSTLNIERPTLNGEEPKGAAVVGREGELARLKEALESARGGKTQCVVIAGQAGGGKTALAEEFLSRVGDGAVVMVGHCFEQFGGGEPYLPVWEGMGRVVRGREGSAVARLMERKAAEVREERAGARGSSERLLREMVEAIEGLARDEVVVLVLEDLHWADYSTLDLVSALVRRGGASRLMIVATVRVEEGEREQGAVARQLVGAGLAEEIRLADLDAGSVEAYLTKRFGAGLCGEFVKRLHRRTGGHPLFLVQLLDDLVEQGVLSEGGNGEWTLQGDGAWVAALETQVPRSVRAMIEADLDRLEAGTRDVLEAAAVAGVEFSAAAVAGALGEDLINVERVCEGLARRGRFLKSAGVDEWPDGTVAGHYRFVHDMHYRVVYERIAVARRAQLHQRVGVCVERVWGERAGEEAAVLAGHFEGGRDWTKAVKYLRTAARGAERQFAHREAAHYLRRAISAVERLPEVERAAVELDVLVPLAVNLRVTKGCGAEEVQQVHARALELCRRPEVARDTRRTFPVLWGIWVYHKVRSNMAEAEVMGQELMAVARAAGEGETGMWLHAHQACGATALCLAKFEEAVEHMEAAERIFEQAGWEKGSVCWTGQDPYVATQSFGAVALGMLGRWEEAAVATGRAAARAEGLKQPNTAAMAAFFGGMMWQMRGDARQVLRCAAQSIEIGEREGLAIWIAGGMVLRGWARGEAGGVEEIRRGLEAWLATGSRSYHPYFLGVLADALARCGRGGEAVQAAREGLRVVGELGERLCAGKLAEMVGGVAGASD